MNNNIKEINNLHLINGEKLVFKINNELIPPITYQVNFLSKILPFNYDVEGSKLIVFIISGFTDMNLLIFQKDNSNKFVVLYPREISFQTEKFVMFISQFFLVNFHIISVPHVDLTELSSDKEDSIFELFSLHYNKRLDISFLENILEVRIEKNVPNIYNIIHQDSSNINQQLDIIHQDSSNINQQLGITTPKLNSPVPMTDSSNDTPLIHSPSRLSPIHSPIANFTDIYITSPKPHINEGESLNIKSVKPKVDLVSLSQNKIVPDIDLVAGKQINELGKGVYGVVYETDKGLAVKKYNNPNLSISSLMETSILIYLNHPNIISLINVQLKPLSLSMEIANGNLLNFDLSDKDSRKWIFFQIFRGIKYCHDMNVWHRDLKPENILIFKDELQVKIADFGISIVNPRQRLTDEVVTLFWRAPEVTLELSVEDYNGTSNDKAGYNELIDEWSIGVMLLDKILNTDTFRDYTNPEHAFSILKILGLPKQGEWDAGRRKFLELFQYPRDIIDYIIVNRDLTLKKTPGWNKIEDDKMLYSINQIKEEKNIRLLDVFAEIANIDADEFEIINNTITWPGKRLTCTQIMDMKYFTNYELTMDVKFPVKYEDESSSNENFEERKNRKLNKLIKSQRSITKQNWVHENNRRIIFQWLLSLINLFKIEMRCLFHAMMLFDMIYSFNEILRDALQGYAVTCLKISSALYDDAKLVPIERFVDVTDNTVTANDILYYQNTILTMIDFRTVITTCEDFIYLYIGKDNFDLYKKDDEGKEMSLNYIVDPVKYKKVTYYAFMLMCNYKYTIEYTPLQIAQIAIRAALKSEFVDFLPELKGLPNLYNDDIVDYLEGYEPNDETKYIHDRFYN